MKKPKPLTVIVTNQPTVQEAKEKIKQISKELSAVYSKKLERNYDYESNNASGGSGGSCQSCHYKK